MYQWNDLDGTAGSSRGLRGGDWGTDSAIYLSSAYRNSYVPSDEFNFIGFRLAAVPEPASLGLAATGGLVALGWTMLRRHRR